MMGKGVCFFEHLGPPGREGGAKHLCIVSVRHGVQGREENTTTWGENLRGRWRYQTGTKLKILTKRYCSRIFSYIKPHRDRNEPILHFMGSLVQ